MITTLAALCVICCGTFSTVAAAEKPRLFVLTDIGNEPDDQMSLGRLLLYSNEIDIEGIAATTSVWQKDKTSGVAHLILAVTGNGSPRLTRYRRVIVHVHR